MERRGSFLRLALRRTGRKCMLPTELQWEWACRAGNASPMYYGDLHTDFSRLANLADATLAHFARGDSPHWHPKDARFNDGALVTAPVGSYAPNAWGLCDMIGNAAEWTRSATIRIRTIRRMAVRLSTAKRRKWCEAARGTIAPAGPARPRAGPTAPWQGVFNVGFRVAVQAQ